VLHRCEHFENRPVGSVLHLSLEITGLSYSQTLDPTEWVVWLSEVEINTIFGYLSSKMGTILYLIGLWWKWNERQYLHCRGGKCLFHFFLPLLKDPHHFKWIITKVALTKCNFFHLQFTWCRDKICHNYILFEFLHSPFWIRDWGIYLLNPGKNWLTTCFKDRNKSQLSWSWLPNHLYNLSVLEFSFG
jgi:hypothetical protein